MHISHNEFQSLGWDLALILFSSHVVPPLKVLTHQEKMLYCLKGQRGKGRHEHIMTQSLTFPSLKKSLFNIENVSME